MINRPLGCGGRYRELMRVSSMSYLMVILKLLGYKQ